MLSLSSQTHLTAKVFLTKKSFHFNRITPESPEDRQEICGICQRIIVRERIALLRDYPAVDVVRAFRTVVSIKQNLLTEPQESGFVETFGIVETSIVEPKESNLRSRTCLKRSN